MHWLESLAMTVSYSRIYLYCGIYYLLLAVTVQFTASTFNVSESNDHKPVTLAVSRSTGILFYVVVKAASQTATGNIYIQHVHFDKRNIMHC